MRAYSLLGLPGYKVVTNSFLTKAGPTRIEKRSWRERIFSLPWRPLEATRCIPTTVPSDEFYLMKDQGLIVMHPEMLNRLTEHIKDEP